MAYDYWYDAQIPRFLRQVVRAFSGFSYSPGMVGGVQSAPVVVPCRLAIRDKMVANILLNNSQNALLSAPMITINLTGVALTRDRLQAPSYARSVNVVERFIDQTGAYTNQEGNGYTVESLMPSPLELTIDVDVWTSNWDQKFQLIEQIFVVFYPDIAIQNSDNAVDWTALTSMTMDDLQLTNRSVPIGTSDEIEIATFKFKLPMWISAPSKVKRQNIIKQIITNIGVATTEPIIDDPFSADPMAQIVTTPGDHAISVIGNQIKLLGPNASEVDQDGNPYSWQSLLVQYGAIRPGTSQMLLKTNEDMNDPTGIIGTIQYTNDPSILVWQVNPSTLPSNTLGAINAVINPQDQGPGHNLPNVANGQRYLILSDMGPSQLWGQIAAPSGTIIQFTNGQWTATSFDKTKPQYVVNLSTGKQLHWDSTDWGIAVEGRYLTGMWRVNL